MSEEDADAGEKPYEASQKKLDDARKKGEVPSSTDLTAAASYGGFLLAGILFGAAALAGAVNLFSYMLQSSPQISRDVFGFSSRSFTGVVIIEMFKTSWVWFVMPLVFALATIIIQQSLVFSTEKLKPKLSRISPLSNAKQKFGRSGLFEFAKSFTKLMIYSLVLAMSIWANAEDIVLTASMSVQTVIAVMFDVSLDFFVAILAIALSIGGIDFLWQKAEHLRKHRMSHKELRDETKESEGDPWMKGERRQRGYDIATNKMLDEVRTADVVIVNPEHYAVALRWERAIGGAPVCVAKGVDEVAARIRSKASETGIPIRRDPPTARALYATIGLGEEILPEHYRTVAAAIRFADKMKAKMSKRGWS